ncbi:MAG: hypothetical protein ASARMPRED_007306 [Alectoria sarmentosa]|nr:MAG: hypothetical protein ASARMPRED_007306 [Alectoria sarmentosa]
MSDDDDDYDSDSDSGFDKYDIHDLRTREHEAYKIAQDNAGRATRRFRITENRAGDVWIKFAMPRAHDTDDDPDSSSGEEEVAVDSDGEY